MAGGRQNKCFATDIFPLEVWEGILDFLKHEDLLACRLVCKDWRSLVDDVFERYIWKPYFAKNRVADVLSTFLVKCKGSRFGDGNDVDVFIDEHERSKDRKQNPFINHTMILNCRSIEQYTQLCHRFPLLVELYGHHVRQVLYFVHNEVPISVRNIPLIFTMGNLHSLTIYCADWDKRGIKNILDLWKNDPFPAPQLKYFKNLSVLGDRGYTVLKNIFAPYGPQIRRLNCWGHNLMEDASRDFARDVADTATSLEEFKVCDVSSTLLTSLCARAKWQLKRLSIKISFSDDTINLGTLMEALRKFAPTLESLYVQVDERQLHNNVFLFDICFPHVKDLRLPLFFARGMPYYMFDITKKFPAVEQLQLVDTDESACDDWEEMEEREEMHAEVVDSLWAKLPATVQTISVRYRKNGEQRASGGLVVFKYRKTRVAREGEEKK